MCLANPFCHPSNPHPLTVLSLIVSVNLKYEASYGFLCVVFGHLDVSGT